MTELEKGAGLISISVEKNETEVHSYGETFFFSLLLASLGKKALSCSVRLTTGIEQC